MVKNFKPRLLSEKGLVLIRVGLASLSLACVQPFLFSLFKIAIFIIIIEVEDFFSPTSIKWHYEVKCWGILVDTVKIDKDKVALSTVIMITTHWMPDPRPPKKMLLSSPWIFLKNSFYWTSANMSIIKCRQKGKPLFWMKKRKSSWLQKDLLPFHINKKKL